MAPKRGTTYDVKIIADAILRMHGGGSLDAFLEECKREGHRMTVSPALTELSVHYLNGNIGIELRAPGSDCPLCPTKSR